jgi:hypothetical protein
VKIIGFYIIFEQESFEWCSDFFEDGFGFGFELGTSHFGMEIDAVHDALNKEAGFFVGTESFLDSIGLGEELDKAFSIEFLFVFLYEDFLEVFADDTVEPETTNIRQAKVVFDEDGFNWFGRALNRDLFVLNEGHLKGIGANIEEEDFLGFILCSLGDGIIDGSCGVLIDDGQDVEIGNGGGLE